MTLGGPRDYGCTVIGRTPSRLTTIRRTIAALLAFAMVAVTMGGLAHRAIVEHVACEHGQLVELAGERSQAAGDHSVVATSAEHDHHHCALASYRCTSIAVPAAPLHGTTLLATVVARPASSAPALRTTLREAPKTSPPV